jgi:hypothetical protein
MMNSTGLYPARSYSALGPAACCTHRPKGRGGLLAGGPAHDQCGLASACCALWAVTLPRADAAARLPPTSRGVETRGGLRLKHQWGGVTRWAWTWELGLIEVAWHWWGGGLGWRWQRLRRRWSSGKKQRRKSDLAAPRL